MTRLIALTVLAAVLLAVAAPARADARPTCRSGKTLFMAGKTRVFTVWQPIGEGNHGDVVYGCSARIRTPRRFGSTDPSSPAEDWGAGPRFGHRVVIVNAVTAESLGGQVGWWDERTGRTRFGWYEDLSIDHAVIGSDGAMAVVSEDFLDEEGDKVAYLCVGRKRLGSARVLAKVDPPGIDPQSLRVRANRITWRTEDGLEGSAPRDDRSCGGPGPV
jgi:hypothetical protein